MSESPEEWLGRLFEFEYCAECGGDAEDHEVCLVLGNYFARCKRAHDAVADDDTSARGRYPAEPPKAPTATTPIETRAALERAGHGG